MFFANICVISVIILLTLEKWVSFKILKASKSELHPMEIVVFSSVAPAESIFFLNKT